MENHSPHFIRCIKPNSHEFGNVVKQKTNDVIITLLWGCYTLENL